MSGFGSFTWLCEQVPSYSWCNVFYRQIQRSDNSSLIGLSANPERAPVGVNPACGIQRIGQPGRLGNIANTIACGLGLFFVLYLVSRVNRRKAAVGRVEFRIFLLFYALSLPLQIISTGSFLQQGSIPLVVITSIHAGVVASLFWTLIGNAVVATQIVEDGTLSSLIPFWFFSLAFFIATTYISLDTALGFTDVFQFGSLVSIPLFVLTSIWPGFAALLFFLLMAYVVVVVLQETKPLWYYVAGALSFVLSQLDYFLLSRIICTRTNEAIDGSFVATILETLSVFFVFLAWRSITEETWDDEPNYRY